MKHTRHLTAGLHNNDNTALNIKIKSLNEALTEAAETNLERHKHLERDFIYSEDLEEMFKTRQRLKEEGEHDRVKQMTAMIRRRIKKERLDTKIKHLEEELWFDIKKAKRGFVPNHSKLANNSGEVIKYLHFQSGQVNIN